MVCLEVVFKTGVPVRETPSRKAKTVATLKCQGLVGTYFCLISMVPNAYYDPIEPIQKLNFKEPLNPAQVRRVRLCAHAEF